MSSSPPGSLDCREFLRSYPAEFREFRAFSAILDPQTGPENMDGAAPISPCGHAFSGADLRSPTSLNSQGRTISDRKSMVWRTRTCRLSGQAFQINTRLRGFATFPRFPYISGQVVHTGCGPDHSRGIGAERAWQERLRITVRAECQEPYRPLSIIVREPPAPFRSLQ